MSWWRCWRKRYGRYSTEEVCRRLKEEDIAYNQVMHSVDVHRDPQAVGRTGWWWNIPTATVSTTMIPMPPVMFGDKHELEVRYPYPRVGEHSAEILREIGFSDEKIQEMIDRKAVSQSE